MEYVMSTTGIYSVAILAAVLMLASCSRESADWKSATTADTREGYQQFLQQHPKSSNADSARTRLQALAEERDWQAAAAVDTRAAYERFVAQHADSKWVQEARIRIENFAQAGTSSNSSAAAVAAAPAVPAPAPPTAKAAAPKASPAKAPTRVATATPAHGTFVQLGAFKTKERAQSEWKALSAKFPTELKSLKPDYVEGKGKNGTVYRLRVPVSSVAAAKGLCGQLKKHSQLCIPVTA
jgi:cell division septation protein DedD